MPVAALAPVVAAGRSRCVSLQVGPRARDLAQAVRRGGPVRPPDGLGETAAAISALDLVIAVDTAVAHLAGALGIPVWLMLPHAPDWRWMLGREDSPWYAGMRLFRQAARAIGPASPTGSPPRSPAIASPVPTPWPCRH